MGARKIDGLSLKLSCAVLKLPCRSVKIPYFQKHQCGIPSWDCFAAEVFGYWGTPEQYLSFHLIQCFIVLQRMTSNPLWIKEALNNILNGVAYPARLVSHECGMMIMRIMHHLSGLLQTPSSALSFHQVVENQPHDDCHTILGCSKPLGPKRHFDIWLSMVVHHVRQCPVKLSEHR